MENQPPPDYGFIYNPQTPAKKSWLPSGGSKKSRLLIALGGVLILFILGMIVSSVLSSSDKALKNDILSALQQRAEIVRIAELGTKDAVDSETKNLAVSTELTLTSNEEALLAIAQKAEVDTSDKIIKLGLNKETDKALSDAKQVNRFDETFSEIIRAQLNEYRATLQRIYEASNNETNKQNLSDMFNNATLLIGE